MLGRRRLGRRRRTFVLGPVAILVATKVSARLVVEAAPSMMASAMARPAIKRRRRRRRRRRHVGCRGCIGLVVGRRGIRSGRGRRGSVGIGPAHWSGRCRGVVAIKSNPDRGSHQLSLWPTSIVVAAVAAVVAVAAVTTAPASSASAVCSWSRVRLRVSAPLLGRGAVLRRCWIALAVGRLRRGRVRRRTAVGRLLLVVHLRRIVRMVVLGGQRSMGRVRGVRSGLRRVLLSVFRVPLLLRRLRIARLMMMMMGGMAGVRCRILMAVGGLLSVVVRGMGLVVAAAVGTSATSTAMAATRRAVGWVAGRATARRRRRRSWRRGSVVVRHDLANCGRDGASLEVVESLKKPGNVLVRQGLAALPGTGEEEDHGEAAQRLRDGVFT